MNYSLAPEVKYPNQIYEICDCINFLIKNQDKYNLDMMNFFIVGDSAGAQLNHQISTIISSIEYRDLFHIEFNEGFSLKAIALNCGIYSLGVTPFGPIALSKTYMPLNWKNYKKTFNINKYMTSNFPPTFIMSGCDDPLKLFLKPMTKRLKKYNIETVSKLYGIKNKDKCPHVFHVDMNNPVGQLANKEECEFFLKHVK